MIPYVVDRAGTERAGARRRNIQLGGSDEARGDSAAREFIVTHINFHIVHQPVGI